MNNKANIYVGAELQDLIPQKTILNLNSRQNSAACSLFAVRCSLSTVRCSLLSFHNSPGDPFFSILDLDIHCGQFIPDQIT